MRIVRAAWSTKASFKVAIGGLMACLAIATMAPPVAKAQQNSAPGQAQPLPEPPAQSSGASWQGIRGENPAPNITNYVAQGNLESRSDLGCIGLSEATNKHNPVDLLRAMDACLTEKDYDRAAQLFALSGAFGRFDMKRVTDRSAHQALLVAQQNVLLNLELEQATALPIRVKELSGDPEAHAKMCSAIRDIGPPSYYPRYMIEHGIGVFTGNRGAVDASLDVQSSWDEVLDQYLRCPPG